MKKSGFVILFLALVLAACGEKSEVESVTISVPSPSAERDMPVVTNEPMQAPVTGMNSDEAMPAPVTAKPEPPVQMKMPATNGSDKAKPLSQEAGLALAKESGCLICHKIETKFIGPAWNDVSKRYKGDADASAKLFASVKSGSAGKWTAVTGGMPMPPNSPGVSDENIDKLVSFIMSL